MENESLTSSETDEPLTKNKTIGRPKKEKVVKPDMRKIRSEAQIKSFEKAQEARKNKYQAKKDLEDERLAEIWAKKNKKTKEELSESEEESEEEPEPVKPKRKVIYKKKPKAKVVYVSDSSESESESESEEEEKVVVRRKPAKEQQESFNPHDYFR